MKVTASRPAINEVRRILLGLVGLYEEPSLDLSDDWVVEKALLLATSTLKPLIDLNGVSDLDDIKSDLLDKIKAASDDVAF